MMGCVPRICLSMLKGMKAFHLEQIWKCQSLKHGLTIGRERRVSARLLRWTLVVAKVLKEHPVVGERVHGIFQAFSYSHKERWLA